MRLPPARATTGLVALTVLAWAAATTGGLTERLSTLAGFVPARPSHAALLPALGGVPAWATPLSATLVHANLTHLGFNMLILAFCGRYVEASLGPGLLLLLYGIGAYAAAAAQYAVAPQSVIPMIGASGAASAVIGAYALLFGRGRAAGGNRSTQRLLHALWLGVAWIGLQLLVGLAAGGMPGVPPGGSIAIAAHIGGFAAGLALARPLLLWRYRRA